MTAQNWTQTSGKTWRVTIDREEPVSQAYLDALAQLNTTAQTWQQALARQTTTYQSAMVYWLGV